MSIEDKKNIDKIKEKKEKKEKPDKQYIKKKKFYDLEIIKSTNDIIISFD